MITSYSKIIEKTLLNCLENNINFTAYFVVTEDNTQLKEKVLNLQKKGLNIIWTTLGNLPYFMGKMNKVFCAGKCIYSNGYMISDAGCAITSLFAKKFRKPFYALMRTFKFINKT